MGAHHGVSGLGVCGFRGLEGSTGLGVYGLIRVYGVWGFRV